MADQKLELTVRVNAETGQIDVLGTKLQELGTKAKGTEESFLGLTGASADIVKQLVPFVSIVGGATFAISKFTQFIGDSIREAEDYRQSIERMRSALETTGGSWTKSGKQIEDWAQAIQGATRFSDNQAITSLDRLTRATGNLAVAQKTAMLAMDISVKTGKEFGEVTDLLTRLILGQNRALQNAQLAFGNVLDGAKNNIDAVQRLSEAYEGAAIAEKTLTSESAKLNNAWGDLQKNVGNMLTPAITKFIETLNESFPALQKTFLVLKGYAVGGFTGLLVDAKHIKDAFSEIDDKAKKAAQAVENLKTGSGGLGDALKNFTPPKLAQDTAEEESKRKQKEEAVAASNDRLAQMEFELNAKMAAIGADTYDKKMALLRAEETAEIAKLNKEVGGEELKEKRIAQINAIYSKRSVELAKQAGKEKADVALSVAATAIEALITLNGMEEVKSAGDARRAKFLLALEKSIAIARLWAAEAGKGIAGIAIASAGTALIVAQFAAQSKAIDRAREANNQEKLSTSVTTDVDGGSITDTYGAGGSMSGGSGGGGTYSSGGGGGGGGGSGTVINIGPTQVTFTAESVDLSNVDMIARRLGDAVTRAKVDAAQMALAIYNSGVKQQGLAR